MIMSSAVSLSAILTVSVTTGFEHDVPALKYTVTAQESKNPGW
jgi:hypothetical protein